MIDQNLLRHQLEIIKKKLLIRGFTLNVKKIEKMEKDRKIFQIKTENFQAIRNTLSKKIGILKRTKKNTSEIENKVSIINKKIYKYQNKLNDLKVELFKIYSEIPNIPSEDTIFNCTEEKNKEITKWGKIKKFNFKVKDHIELGKKLEGLDSESSVKISGSKFVVMKGKIALLHRALSQFMIDTHTVQHGYLETYVPYLVNSESLYGTGQLPKFSSDLFHIQSFDQKNQKIQYTLIPTAEVPLTNLVRNKVLNKKDLPVKLTALTPCFRAEPSSYGKESRGLIRMHQFEKVEIVQIVHPKYSMQALEELTLHAERILKLLNLPYRKVQLCALELGFAASKTYDLEVWFPAEKKYREISSCSNMIDFQARRMKSKYKSSSKKTKKKFLHTINGSALALSRTLAAILENYQLEDGTIEVPIVLQNKYMNGLKIIS
ncbi:serine--tRNA ligase [Buchnera aphidicola]|uniref:serine--tRNA ligase n=1 Tax=Buchnera aphidicola TaxID=9 RepID=UPI0034646D12